jgi:hypothetical protein
MMTLARNHTGPDVVTLPRNTRWVCTRMGVRTALTAITHLRRVVTVAVRTLKMALSLCKN